MKIILMGMPLLWMTNMFFSNLYAIDSLGYRYYHDLDNEHDGSKFRAMLQKSFI